MGKRYEIYLKHQNIAYKATNSTNKRRVLNKDMVSNGTAKRNIETVYSSNTGKNSRDRGSIISGKHDG